MSSSAINTPWKKQDSPATPVGTRALIADVVTHKHGLFLLSLPLRRTKGPGVMVFAS